MAEIAEPMPTRSTALLLGFFCPIICRTLLLFLFFIITVKYQRLDRHAWRSSHGPNYVVTGQLSVSTHNKRSI